MGLQAERIRWGCGKIISLQSLVESSQTALPNYCVSATDASAESSIARFANQCERAVSAFELTNREADVFFLLVRGRNVPFIARALNISSNTVKTHVTHLYEKMGVTSRQEMIDAVEAVV